MAVEVCRCEKWLTLRHPQHLEGSQQILHRIRVRARGPPHPCFEATWGSRLAAECLGPLTGANMPAPATAARLAALITFLPSDDGRADPDL